jgi:hypothetical protein
VEVTQEFIAGLRRRLADEMAFDDHPPSVELSVMAAFDRAVLAMVLDGAAPAVNPFSERARKAARTRARHKREKAESVGSGVGDPGALGP